MPQHGKAALSRQRKTNRVATAQRPRKTQTPQERDATDLARRSVGMPLRGSAQRFGVDPYFRTPRSLG